MTIGYTTVQDEWEALHDRTLRLRVADDFSTLIFLKQGQLSWGKEGQAIQGPALCYWPHGERPVLTLGAGGSARILGLSDNCILDAMGARAESVHLRMLIEYPYCVLVADSKNLTQVEALFDWYGDEYHDVDRQSPMSLAAYLRLIFVSALRIYRPVPSEAGADQTSILRQFRHLVELHYKEHWLVPRYADELGVERDRLHRICKRETGRSPAELVYERLTAEAKARLEMSGFPLKRIAADLGFADATRFSHFFKRRTDISPGAYRAIVSAPDADDLVELKRGFADWP